MPDHTAAHEPEPLTITEAAEPLRAPVATLRLLAPARQQPRSFRLGRHVWSSRCSGPPLRRTGSAPGRPGRPGRSPAPSTRSVGIGHRDPGRSHFGHAEDPPPAVRIVPRSLLEPPTVLVAGRDQNELLFARPGGRMLRIGNFRRRVFDEAARHAGLTPHERRHTAARIAVSAGANVKAVHRLLGHASAAMTLDVYSDLFDDDLTALADRMDAAARAAEEACVGTVWARPPIERPEMGKRAAHRGGPRGDRTLNPRIKSPLLCQLS
ncbi:MAG: Site-specific recombinase XerD [Frankiales bacterium]|nr:Site-specific recombinase XerD [Frankiales bacterium]